LIKKIVFAIILIGVSFGIGLAASKVDTDEAQRTVELAQLNREVEAYQREIEDLEAELAAAEAEQQQQQQAQEQTAAEEQPEEDEDTYIPSVIYGFFARSTVEIREEGDIILDAGATPWTMSVARDTGREVLYFYNPEVSVPSDGGTVILRSQYNSVANRAKIKGTISCYKDDLPAGMLSDGRVNIPHIYSIDDDTPIMEQLEGMDAAIVIFDYDVSENVRILEEAIANGELLTGTVDEVAMRLIQRGKDLEEKQQEQETQPPEEPQEAPVYVDNTQEIRDRIAELQAKIEDIYASGYQG